MKRAGAPCPAYPFFRHPRAEQPRSGVAQTLGSMPFPRHSRPTLPAPGSPGPERSGAGGGEGRRFDPNASGKRGCILTPLKKLPFQNRGLHFSLHSRPQILSPPPRPPLPSLPSPSREPDAHRVFGRAAAASPFGVGHRRSVRARSRPEPCASGAEGRRDMQARGEPAGPGASPDAPGALDRPTAGQRPAGRVFRATKKKQRGTDNAPRFPALTCPSW